VTSSRSSRSWRQQRTGKSVFNIHHDVIATPRGTALFLTHGGEVTLRDTTWLGDEIWEWDPVSDAIGASLGDRSLLFT